MPRIVDYATVKDRLLASGLLSLYHNAGAFGFDRDAEVKMLGWIGATDPSIRPEMQQHTRRIPPPLPENLTAMLIAARAHLPGDAWLMPKSHWHFELQDGHPHLLEALLPEIGIDPSLLRQRNDGSAIAFSADENQPLRRAIERLLAAAGQSDFAIAFPDAKLQALCTIHHHQQLWWQTTDLALMSKLEAQSTQSST